MLSINREDRDEILTGLTQKIGFHNELEVYRKERAMICPTTNALTSENEQNA